MAFFVIFLTVGVALGLSIRKIAQLAKTSEKVLTLLYYPCLFIAGIFFHLDEKIVSNINKIGWPSFFNIFIVFATVIILIWSVIKLSKLVLHVKN